MPGKAALLPPRYADPALIARGGMGEIYLAEDTELGRPVAVKLLAEHMAGDPALRARFTREALAAARLSGEPHVVTIFDVGEWNHRPFIVMEYLPGGSVAERLTAGPPDRSAALAWLDQAAEALDAAHRRGVVHRDVKPANLLLDESDRVHVADFGIALVADQATAMTAAGTVLGTAGYLSPEQARGLPASAASDVYSLAVVAYELLTGVRPFARESSTAEAAAHVHEEPPPASERAPVLPRSVDRTLARGLAKDPSHRPPAAAALVAELRKSLEPSEQPTAVVAAPTVPLYPEPRRGNRYLPALLIAFVLAAAAAGAVFAALSGGDDELAEAPQAAPAPAPPAPTPEPPPPEPSPPEPSPPPEPQPTPPPEPVPAEPPPASGDPRDLNDQGFALINENRFEEALPLLEEAVRGLQGTYSDGDRFEAYAEFNLGFALLQLGRCEEALPHLERSEQLQGNRGPITSAKQQVRRCLRAGGDGEDEDD